MQLIQTPKFCPQITSAQGKTSTCESQVALLPFFSFFPVTFQDTPVTHQHVAYGPVVVVSGGHFCFDAFLLFFLFSAQKSKNTGTPRHHNIHPFDAFHCLSSSQVQPFASQRSCLKPQEKPNRPPTSKRAALRSQHMRQQGPEQLQTPFESRTKR
jgi:hypothetical protein